jgi:hypothetical protein
VLRGSTDLFQDDGMIASVITLRVAASVLLVICTSRIIYEVCTKAEFRRIVYSNSADSIDSKHETLRTNEQVSNFSEFAAWAPITDDIQLFSYANALTDGLCASIESAILAGWTYQLIGPTVTLPKFGSTLHPKFDKNFALSVILNVLPKNVTIVFADAFDVLYQRSFIEFRKAVLETEYKNGHIIFASESNCWPFNRSNRKTYSCPLMQGKNWYPGSPNQSLGCKLQVDLYKKYLSNVGTRNKPDEVKSIYLNSGLSVGTVGNYSHIIQSALQMTQEYSRLCLDDQGLSAWLMVRESQVPISLDYQSVLFGTFGEDKLVFDPKEGLIKIRDSASQAQRNMSDLIVPFMIHFNGGGKPHFNRTRDQLVGFRNRKEGVFDFLKEETFYIDGIQKKFIQECDAYVNRHYIGVKKNFSS